MVAYFNVFGRQVGSHVLAMATLGGTAAIATLSMSGGEKKTIPPIGAKSDDEEKFIKEFLAQAEKESKPAAKH
ncbi:hypothetical protein FPQ18DRAFT_389219 [Pyronema domesticum]|nr:hypothetical protein FPQ18DRAFT_389219 [Pyronema domesticum]